jgi:endonuclease/exonuclease/phosphatase family metal-dependent hydrolase
MRFLSYNLWHGLTPSSPVAFESLEPHGRRLLREQAQVDLLKSLKPDVCFFQEVNPAASRAANLAKELNMSFAYQSDLVGLKFFGIGLPLNLNSGLVILAAKSFCLKKLEGTSLSRPGTHFVHGWGSWQLKEERFALFTEAMLPKWGRVLLVNTHLHHGLEATPAFLEDLDKLAKELEISEGIVAEIKNRLTLGSERRVRELSVLMQTIEKYQRRYEVIVIAGDFNARPDSELFKILNDQGFQEMWATNHPDQPGYSFDSVANPANHILQQSFPLSLVVEDLSFSSKTKEALMTLARRQENQPRRIDYIWARGGALSLKARQVELVGKPDTEGLAPSDHFGVCADLELG